MYSQTWKKIMFSFENINIDQHFAEVSICAQYGTYMQNTKAYVRV